MVMKKLIFILMVVLLAIFIYIWFFMYNKPHIDVQSKKPDVVISAETLIKDFSENPQKKHQELLNKIIAVEAPLITIINKDSFQIAQVKIENFPYVIEASLFHDMPDDNFRNATVKGIYVGYMEAEEDFGLDGSIQLKRSVIAKK